MTMRRCGALGFSPHFLTFVQDLHAQQIRWMSKAQPAVIQIPVPLKEQMKREKKTERRKKEALRTQQSRMGDLNVPIISCKRKEFNHYRGQTYSKFAEVPLASKGWTHRKAAGDYFTINSYGGNPAFEQLENNSEKDFDFLGLDEDLVKQLQELGFDMPTNIQTLAIPEVLEGKNTLITAETGNGKTLAFITPMLQQIKNRKRRLKSELPMNSPLGLVIVPGRELAEQIHGVASKIGRGLGIKVKLLVGGNTKKKMLSPPMSHLDLLVATFGSLSKLTTTGVYDMGYLTHITLDEVDTLLDDSFSEQVTRFISKCPVKGVTEDQQPTNMSGVQLTLVAATLPRNLSTILQPIVELDSLVRISTQHLNRFMSHLPQRFFRVNHKTKVEKLVELVKKDAKRGHSVVIFSNQSKTCDWVSMFLSENSVPCINLHGAMYASLRKDKFKTFQSGEVIALSCTDLASRGLDTIGVQHVINYEFPKFISDYIHRCGRVGRVGSPTASLVTNLVHRPQEIELVQKIEYAVRKGEEFHNVNANIKRIITERAVRAEKNMMNLEQLQNLV